MRPPRLPERCPPDGGGAERQGAVCRDVALGRCRGGLCVSVGRTASRDERYRTRGATAAAVAVLGTAAIPSRTIRVGSTVTCLNVIGIRAVIGIDNADGDAQFGRAVFFDVTDGAPDALGLVTGVVPGFLEQRRNRGVEAFDSLTTFDVSSVAEYPIRSVVGHPFRELDAIPGRTGLVLMLAVLLTATFAAAVTVRQGSGLPRAAAALRSERGLMVLLSAATLLGLLLYDAVGPRLFVLRNVSASQPALVVVLALVLADVTRRPPVAPRRAATGLMLSLLAVTAVQTVGRANQPGSNPRSSRSSRATS